ncbi:MAG: hypothetical protein WAN08_15595 [Candidatus Sulfotelmatobacter sp.]
MNVARPFARAESLEKYSNNGYWALGVAVAFGTVLCWISGLAEFSVGQAPKLWQTLYQVTLKRIDPGIASDSATPILAVPLMIYACLSLVKPARLWFGELFANALINLIDRALAAGEWCIAHRWASFFLIVLLAAAVAYGVAYEIEAFQRRQIVEHDYERWLYEAEELVEHSPMTHSEWERYRVVKSDWHATFGEVPADSDIRSPGACLDKMLDELYLSNEERTWSEILILHSRSLEQLLETCPMSTAKQTVRAKKTLALMNILLGRVYVRLFTVRHEPPLLVQAYRTFEKAENLDSFEPTNSMSGYRSAAANGRGTVYAEVLDIFMSNSMAEKSSVLTELCADLHDCEVKAVDEYDRAAKGFMNCSFEEKRKTNNEADLLVRIGSRYDTYVSKSPEIFEAIAASPEALAGELEKRARLLMQCNWTGPFVPPTFVTAAQAFSVAAGLRRKARQSAIDDVRAAGFYLLTAINFEPQNISDWDLSYFCPVVNDQALKSEFRAHLDMPPEELRQTDRLLRMIQKKCPHSN